MFKLGNGSEVAAFIYFSFVGVYLLTMDNLKAMKSTHQSMSVQFQPLLSMFFLTSYGVILVALYHFLVSIAILASNQAMRKVCTLIYTMFVFVLTGQIFNARSQLNGQGLSEALERFAYHALILSILFGTLTENYSQDDDEDIKNQKKTKISSVQDNKQDTKLGPNSKKPTKEKNE